MICPKQHKYYKDSAEENVLRAIFGQNRDLPIEMELVVNSPGYQLYQCPACSHTKTVFYPDAE